VIDGFCSEIDENCDIPVYYAVNSGNVLPTCRDKLSVQSSGVDPLRMAPIIFVNTNLTHNSFSCMFISILYMFRAAMCPS